MTREQAMAFAQDWALAWNARDLERVLTHFDEGIVFTSPTALTVIGSAVVRGKQALRSYWAKALSQISSIRFAVDRVVWDEESRELAIVYVSETNGVRKRVSENLTFGASGLIGKAEVFHGVPEQQS